MVTSKNRNFDKTKKSNYDKPNFEKSQIQIVTKLKNLNL